MGLFFEEEPKEERRYSMIDAVSLIYREISCTIEHERIIIYQKFSPLEKLSGDLEIVYRIGEASQKSLPVPDREKVNSILVDSSAS